MVRIAVDVGGTFTDAVAIQDDGKITVSKIKSTPVSPEEGFLSATRLLLSEGNLLASNVTEVVHVGTIGTNLFLGQIGLTQPRTALIATEGFRDVLEIGRQNRPELYNIFFQKPAPLVPRKLRFEISERTDSEGFVMKKITHDDFMRIMKQIREEGVESIAVVFINSYANPTNEQDAKHFLAENLELPVFASTDVDPEHREYERTSTTVVNAILSPLISKYIDSAVKGLGVIGIRCQLQILSSSGGRVDAQEASNRPIVSIESGPAAGVVVAAEFAKRLKIRRVISLDMGGTSAKAGSIVDYVPLVVPEIEVGGRVHMGRVIKGSGYPVRFPSIDLAEVSAGGGTIIWVDETGTVKVGPVSAGAIPGPASYGAGGQDPTITDANLVLGRIGSELLGGKLHLSIAAASSALQHIAGKVGSDVDHVAAISLKLANMHMAKAIHIVSLERGLDPREFSLFSFGGAGPMHAAEVAEEVGINEVIVPPWPGLFSALGMLMSDMKYSYVRGILAPFDELGETTIERLLHEMTSDALTSLRERAVDVSKAKIQRSLDLRYVGQGYELEIPVPAPVNGVEAKVAFEEKHESIYGYRHGDEGLEITALRITVIIPVERPTFVRKRRTNIPAELSLKVRRRTWFDDHWFETPVYHRDTLSQDQTVVGPVIIEEYDSTTVVPPNWTCQSSDEGCLILRRSNH